MSAVNAPTASHGRHTHGFDTAMSWGTALRLAVAGGLADRTRIALTAIAAAAGSLAMLAAATVIAIDAADGPYTSSILNEPGLRQGVVVTLLFLCLPLLVFVGQCTRVGAPARDRRFAALRLTGATPRDVVRVAAGETGLSAALGVVLGLGVFLILRVVLDRVVTATYTLERQITYENGSIGYVTDTFTGLARPLPTNVWPHAWAVLLIVVLVPVLSAAFSTFALRRVSITPFGVTRHEQRPPRRVLPLALFGIGLAGTMVLTTVLQLAKIDIHASIPVATAVGAVFVVLLLLILAGLLLGTSALSAAVGVRLIRSGRPSLLLAGRRLLAAPGQASRANSALLILVLTAAFLQGVQARFNIPSGSSAGDDSLRLIVTMLTLATTVGGMIAVASLLVGTVENIVSRRQVIAGMSAVGIPHSTVRRAVVVENLLPLVPTIFLATASGILAARGVMDTRVRVATLNPILQIADVTVVVIHVPWVPLVVIALGSVLAVTLATVASLPLLRASADPAELRAG